MLPSTVLLPSDATPHRTLKTRFAEEGAHWCVFLYDTNKFAVLCEAQRRLIAVFGRTEHGRAHITKEEGVETLEAFVDAAASRGHYLGRIQCGASVSALDPDRDRVDTTRAYEDTYLGVLVRRDAAA